MRRSSLYTMGISSASADSSPSLHRSSSWLTSPDTSRTLHYRLEFGLNLLLPGTGSKDLDQEFTTYPSRFMQYSTGTHDRAHSRSIFDGRGVMNQFQFLLFGRSSALAT